MRALSSSGVHGAFFKPFWSQKGGLPISDLILFSPLFLSLFFFLFKAHRRCLIECAETIRQGLPRPCTCMYTHSRAFSYSSNTYIQRMSATVCMRVWVCVYTRPSVICGRRWLQQFCTICNSIWGRWVGWATFIVQWYPTVTCPRMMFY